MTSPQIPSSFAQERATIDQGIAARRQELRKITDEYRRQCHLLTTAVRELHEKRNELAPVSRLPPELLSLIFLAHVASFNDAGPQTYYPLGWLPILGVCRHWQRVGIATPQLWVQVLLTRKDYVNTALQRSTGMPLCIRSASESICSHSVYKLLQNEIHRIRAVDLTITDQVLRSLQKLGHKHPMWVAPMLEELSLRWIPWKSPENSTITGLSSLKMPRLRSLTITEGSLSLASSLARSTVNSLHLSFQLDDPVTPNALLDLLNGMPLLQHLELCNLHDTNFPMLPLLKSHIIPLPHLEYVRLHGTTTGLNLARLLQHLSFSDRTRIKLNTSGRRICDETFGLVLPIVMSQTFVALIPGQSCSIQLRPTTMALTTGRLRLRFWYHSLGPSCDLDVRGLPKQPPHMDIEFGSMLPITKPPFLHFLDLSTLSMLNVEPHYMPYDYWVDIFSGLTLPNLEQINLSIPIIDVCSTVLEAIRTPIPAERISTRAVHSAEQTVPMERYLFPSLKTVRLDVSDSRPFSDSSSYWPWCSSSNIYLHCCTSAGRKLKTFEINFLGPGLIAAALQDPYLRTLAESVKISDASGELRMQCE